MAFYPENYWLYATMSGSTIDITPYTIQNDIIVEWGIEGNEAIDLLADTGSMEFVLNNKANLFTPGHANVLGGWQKGIVIELVIRFNHDDFKRFRGTLEDLKYDDTNYTVRCVCLDWLDESAKYPLELLSSDSSQTGDEALTTVLAGMPIQPLATNFDTGNSIFDVVFNDTTTNSKAYTEMSKIANSEFSHIYLTKDKLYGETLVFENREHRTSVLEIDSIEEETDFINSTDGYTTNSTGGKIVYRLVDYDAKFDNTMTHITTEYGKGVINNMKVTAYPKEIDDSVRVLFSINEPIFIASGQTKIFYGSYTDTSGKKCNGIDMVALTATTDYLLNTVSSGGGTDKTSDLTASAEVGSAQVKFTYTNTTVDAYITKSNIRGKGVYTYTPIDFIESDSDSYKEYGYRNATLNQAYQTDLGLGTGIIRTIVENEKDSRTKIIDVSFNANTSNFLMTSFLYLDVGSLIHLTDDRYDIDDYFYIQKVKFTIGIGGVIMFTWKLILALSLIFGSYGALECEFTSESEDILYFENLTQIEDLDQLTYVATINPETYTSGHKEIMSKHLKQEFFLASGTPGALYLLYDYSTADGHYQVTTDRVPFDTYTTVGFSLDTTTNNAPKIYIDGSSVDVTTVHASEGTVTSNKGTPFAIGNVYGPMGFETAFQGKIKDARIYNVILTDTEMAEINSGSNITRGLVFQSPYVRTSDLDAYDGATLAAGSKILDCVYGAVGEVLGSPVTSIP